MYKLLFHHQALLDHHKTAHMGLFLHFQIPNNNSHSHQWCFHNSNTPPTFHNEICIPPHKMSYCYLVHMLPLNTWTYRTSSPLLQRNNTPHHQYTLLPLSMPSHSNTSRLSNTPPTASFRSSLYRSKNSPPLQTPPTPPYQHPTKVYTLYWFRTNSHHCPTW